MSRLPRKIRIRVELVKRQITGAEIGRRVGVCRSAVWQTIDGYTKAKRVRAAIAEALDIPYEELWGEYDNEKEVA